MQKQNTKKDMNILGKKLISIYLMALMIITSFAGIMPITQAEPIDVIHTYDDVSVIPTEEFGDGDTVLVNVSVNNRTGDPLGSPYYVKALNQQTHRWVNVYVTDNNTGPWGEENIPMDKNYWGMFNISSIANSTYNASTLGEYSILQVANGQSVNISEVPDSVDFDGEFASIVITANYGGPLPVGNGTVKGYVKDANNTRIPDATVRLNGSTQYVVNTNGSGYFIFNDNVSAGHYSSEVCKFGIFPWQPGVSFNLSGDQIRWLNFTVGGGNSSIFGYVRNQANGNPIQGATVELYLDSDPQNATPTNESGYYIFNNLSAETYDIKTSKNGVFNATWVNNISLPADTALQVNINVTLGGSQGPEIENFTYKGYVYQNMTDKVPVENVIITIETQGHPSDIIGNGTTDTNGHFEVNITPNATAIGEGHSGATIRVIKDGYEPRVNNRPLQELIKNEDEIFIDKIWNISSHIIGRVLNETTFILEGAMISAQGANWFQNQTMTNETGHFVIGSISGEIELWISADGYFPEMYEVTTHGAEENLGDIHLDRIPEYNAYIVGNITVNGTPLPFAELNLYDPQHPYAGEKESIVANETGYFNISTYAGDFYLVTIAKTIGRRQNGPPIAVGGYVNEVHHIIVNAHETNTTNIDLAVADPDPISINMTFSNWTQASLRMSRTAIGNARLVRMMADTNMNGTLEAEEVEALCADINNSLANPESFYQLMTFLWIPFSGLDVDGVPVSLPLATNVEFSGLIGSSSSSSAPFTLFINVTITEDTSGGLAINTNRSYHGVTSSLYYPNPAFTTTLHVRYPSGYTVRNARREYVSLSALGSRSLTIVPGVDPDYNDTDFTLSIGMFVGSTNSFASFNEAYSYENAIDSDGDGDYNWLMKKVKFNTTTAGEYRIVERLKTVSEILIDTTQTDGSYSGATNPVEFSFGGETIYRSQENGHYKSVVDLYYKLGDYIIWFDSMNQTTASYNYTQFDAPPIYFTREVSDSGLDVNDNDLYDYLVLSLGVDVGQTGYYEFEGDFGLANYQGGDSYLGHVRQTTTFTTTGLQTFALNFDGTNIREKAANGSIWMYVWVCTPQSGQLDSIDHMTEKYFYTDFELPPPENSSVSGNVTDVYGDSVEARVILRNPTTWDENSTTSDGTTGEYLINTAEGNYEMNVGSNNNFNLDWQDEYISLNANENLIRDIKLLPRWDLTERLNIWMDDWQFAAGDIIYMNGSAQGIPLRNSSVELIIYREVEHEGYSGRIYNTTETNTTDRNGTFSFAVNSTGYTNGDYRFEIVLYNETQHRVCRDDRWLQISSYNLDFSLDKSNYRPGAIGTGTYNLTYSSNHLWVQNANYSWKIMYYDWSGEHIVTQGSFVNESGHGTFEFTIPETIDPTRWYDLRFTATIGDADEIKAWYGFGITTGTAIEHVTDEPVGDGDYDFLRLNITVNATTAGTYRISAGLHGEQSQFITGTENETTLPEGSGTINIYFSGEQIRSNEINPFKAWIGLYRSGDWNQLDSMNYVLEDTYLSGQFAAPPVRFEKEHSITDDTVGVGNYDALLINFSINASEIGNFSIDGNLHKEINHGGWTEWIPVAWNNTRVEITHANVSTNVSIRFEGKNIYNSMQEGPWKVNLNLQRLLDGGGMEWLDVWDPPAIISYDYDQFTKPSAFIENITDFGPFPPGSDANLVIGAKINVSEEGNFSIRGDLFSSNQDDHWFIANDQIEPVYLVGIGTHTVNLTFSGQAIYSSGFNGPYRVNIELRSLNSGEWLGGREFSTEAHSYTDFSEPGALFTGVCSDSGYDKDGDGYSDVLRVIANVSFVENSNYEISGELFKQVGYERQFITWANTQVIITEPDEKAIAVNFSGYEIRNKELNGYYGITLRLRDVSQGVEIGTLDFTTTTYYYYDDFELPAVFFDENYNISEGLSSDLAYINITLGINSSEVGDYRIMGDFHKVNNQNGWNQWIWITHSEKFITITETGITEVTLSFDTAMIREAGYPWPYTINFNLMDSSWTMLDSIQEYETQGEYNISNFAALPAEFNGSYYDFLYPATNAQYVKVNVSINVSESGYYRVDGSLRKDWRYLAGNGVDVYLNESEEPQNITLQFDVIELYTNIQNYGIEGLFVNETLNFEAWLRRSGQGNDLDHLSGNTVNKYYTSNFTNTAATIENFSDNGYNKEGMNETAPFDYLNITVLLNFTVAGDYELWSDLTKQSGQNWYWLGWDNEIITVSANDLAPYYTEEVTLQYSGTLLADYDSPYRYHMELRNLSTGRREAMKEGQLDGYNNTDFRGAAVTLVEDSESALGYDSDDADSQYDDLRVTVDINATQRTNIGIFGDLHKESQYGGWNWIASNNNWTTVEIGTTTISLDFDGRTIYNKGLNGPYQIRLELRDTSTWELLDVIERIQTPAYTYDNFQTPSVWFIDGNIIDVGNDTTDSGEEYNTLDVTIPVYAGEEGTYEIMGDLHYNIGGWTWLGWESTGYVTLPEGNSTIKLQFDGITIRNAGISGRYQLRLELRDNTYQTVDMIDQYDTERYNYTDFQRSGAEFVDNETHPSSYAVGTLGNYTYLQLNVTVNCSEAGVNYWVGADLHKESGWQWQWINFQSKEFTSAEGEQTIPILFNGELISNTGVDGPYQTRIELRDTATWTTQDIIQRYETDDYDASDFKASSVIFKGIEDWGNDTDLPTDGKYNYLELNVTINCTQAGTYWLNGDLHKQTGWNWIPIAWSGQEITLDDSGNQTVQLQFSGEQIYGTGENGPYQVRLEINNVSTWMRYDIIDSYTTTHPYTYTQFQSPDIEFVENDTSPSNEGVGTEGSYTYLRVNVTLNSSTGGTYWLGTDLHKRVGWNWVPITWQSQEITHPGGGEVNFSILFDGALIRNSGMDGPYEVRLELRNLSTWNQLDIIDNYQTEVYDYDDFAGAGIELVDVDDRSVDSVKSGNLQMNITVNSTAIGTYELRGMLYKQDGYNWWYITSNNTQIIVNGTRQQTINFTFSGEDIYTRGINGSYQVRMELWRTGTWTIIDSFDGYNTKTYNFTQFLPPQVGVNETETEDYAPETFDYLQVNVTTYSASDTQYQVSAWLFDENWSYIGWAQQTQTIQGFDKNFTLQFDGSMINRSQRNPEKIYIEMRRTSDWRLMDSNTTTLNGTYNFNDFSSGVTINTGTITSSAENYTGGAGYDSLNVTVNITFTTEDIYEISAGLTNQSGNWITGSSIDPTTYTDGSHQITIPFNGIDIYSRGIDGPYVVAFISVSKNGTGEIFRQNNVKTTGAYSYTAFEHPDAGANLTGTYSSEGWDQDADGEYEYLNVTVSVVVGVAGSYEFNGDLYSEDGTAWIDGDNDTANLSIGTHTVTLYFEGDAIYASLTDGPYILGYIRVGAVIDDSFILLDSASNAHTTHNYTYNEFESEAVVPIVPSNVRSVSVSNDPFSPNSDGSKDTTLVTVTADSGPTLYLNIYNNSNILKRTGLTLSGTGGSYTATWNGKDDSSVTVSDGTYRIKVSDDASGDPSGEATQTTTVVVDTAAPTGATVTINSGNAYTNTTSVTLTLTATDESNKKMRFKNNASWSDWEDFGSSKSWTLRAVDGTRTVYYQVKDLAENLATAVTDTITLDTAKPSNVTFTITGIGDTPTTYTNSVSVTLAITAADATSGLYQMLIGNDATFTGSSWETYSTSKSWTLTSGDGNKSVYLKVKDTAGLIADVVSDSITLDTVAPTSLTISIESGQTYARTNSVNLSLSATGAVKMQFSRNGTYNSTWETYATTRSWSLSSGDGTKTLHFRAKDSAGNIATAVNDTIILDTTAPTFSSVTSTSISQTGATITWTTTEASTSQVLYGVTTSYGSHTTLDATKVTSHSQAITGLIQGTSYHYKVVSLDTAGNNGTSTDSTFTTSSGVDITPPSAITGLAVTDKRNAEATVTIAWTASAASDFVAYKVYRRTSSFTNVTLSGVTLLTTISSISTTTYEDTTATDDQTFYYAVTAIDTASPPNENKTVTSISGTSLDDKKPTTSDNIPTGWQRTVVTVTFTATDYGKGVNRTYYTTDGTDPSNVSNAHRQRYTTPFSVGGDNGLGDRDYTISYYSYDLNTTPNVEALHTKTLKVDTAAPSSDDNAPSGWRNSAVTVTLTASDVTSGVNKIFYTTDGSTPGNSSSQYSSALLFSSQGTTTLKYRAKDNATNMESPNTATIKIDTTAPTSSVTTLSTYKTSPFNISWTSSDALSGVKNVTVQVRNGTGGSWTDWNTNLTASSSTSYIGVVGYTYYFRSKAYDNATNVESVSGYDTFTTVVSSTPTAEISSPSDSDGDSFIYVRGTVTFIGNATDTNFSKYWLNYSADGVAWHNIANSTTAVVDDTLGTWNTTGLTEMIYNISLKVKNIGGYFNFYNLTESNNRTFIVDNTAPTLTSISSGTPTASSAIISWTTDENGTSIVKFGTTTSYGTFSNSSTYVTSHSRTLSSLSASTTYHYQVISLDNAGNMNNSSDATFTTAAADQPPAGPSGEGPGEDTGPTISEVSHTPTTVTSSNFVTFYAAVTADTGHTITLVTLYWNDGSEHSKAMTKGSGSTYSSEIRPFLDGLTIRYWIIAKDNASRTTTSANYSFTVVDNAGPAISELVPEDGSIIGDTTPTIHASYSDPSGVDVTSVFITVDGVNTTALATRTTTQISYTPATEMSIGDHTVIVAASDVKKNKATTTWSFTIRKEIFIVNEIIENISAGETTEISFGDTDTGIDTIEITAADNLYGATITVERLMEKPADVTEPTTTNVYAYLNIESTAPEGSIESLTIKFKVEQTWLTENNIDKNNVVLMRYHNNAWEQLDTTMLNEDTTYVYYQATAAGMSTFAIAVSEPIIKPGESQMPLLFIAIIIIVLAVIALVVLLYYRKLI